MENNYLNQKELAQELGCSVRTIQRYIKELDLKEPYNVQDLLLLRDYYNQNYGHFAPKNHAITTRNDEIARLNVKISVLERENEELKVKLAKYEKNAKKGIFERFRNRWGVR